MREGEQLRQSRSNQAERISSILCSICVSVLSVLFIPFLFAALTRVLYYRLISCNKVHEDFLKEELYV
jgi:hypothetical protein